jgi:hypothetical protein
MLHTRLLSGAGTIGQWVADEIRKGECFYNFIGTIIIYMHALYRSVIVG